ncbi:hypothetical protein KM043_007706 [Ampulex compressa]|nr:hypothetical protein KM043_007706 [Ampulex compressa]
MDGVEGGGRGKVEGGLTDVLSALCFRPEEGPQSRQLRRPVHVLQVRQEVHVDRLPDETPEGGLREAAKAQVHAVREEVQAEGLPAPPREQRSQAGVKRRAVPMVGDLSFLAL